ncbi:hypothetical protein KR51_00020690 [Rubidibacter lacunae KORDI 51-2]|uniref:Uncharacterized protein n=1 Tax=Rubidibacter lacunae KORDI 51-2 TaxID=582515 RepID=U5DKQ1_9CHRO|nr:hypothetical protein KR51_00020690 [Rubidibacter lacunae KORDI 51-2]
MSFPPAGARSLGGYPVASWFGPGLLAFDPLRLQGWRELSRHDRLMARSSQDTAFATLAPKTPRAWGRASGIQMSGRSLLAELFEDFLSAHNGSSIVGLDRNCCVEGIEGPFQPFERE